MRRSGSVFLAFASYIEAAGLLKINCRLYGAGFGAVGDRSLHFIDRLLPDVLLDFPAQAATAADLGPLPE
jgi:hypothetical protein